MPPKPLVELESLDLSNVVAGPDEIRRCNPHRFEMELLEGVLHLDLEQGVAVGYKDVRDDEFWVRGHVPGRPLLPGVLMCEAAAQLSSFVYHQVVQTDRFLGFGGMENVKFRGQVVPGDRLILVAKKVDLKPRRAVFECQAFVRGAMVYEGTVIGMPL